MSTKTLIKFAVAFGVLAIVLIFLGVNFVPRIQAFSKAKEYALNATIRDVSATRWQALGDLYTMNSVSVPNIYASIRNVSATRWQALGDFYSKYAASVLKLDASIRDVSAARWQALGEYYAKISTN